MPLRWHALEQIMQQMSEKLDRKVFNEDECKDIAKNLQIDPNSCDTALEFFSDLNMLFYWRKKEEKRGGERGKERGPNLVILKPQLILNIVSELVKKSHQMRSKISFQQSEPTEGNDELFMFKDHREVTEKFLESLHIQYEPPLFTFKELIELFGSLLVVAKLSNDAWFMPSLLEVVPKDKVQDYRCNPKTALVIHFPDGGPLHGMFCCLVAFVLSRDDTDRCPWKVLMKNKEPKCLKRNVIQFKAPKLCGSITMIDQFTHFEVHVQTRAEKTEDQCKLWQLVYKSVFKGLEKASKILGYGGNTYEHAIICSAPSSELHPDFLHLATVSSEGWWICSKNNEIGGEMNSSNIPWWRDSLTATSSTSTSTATNTEVQTSTSRQLDQHPSNPKPSSSVEHKDTDTQTLPQLQQFTATQQSGIPRTLSSVRPEYPYQHNSSVPPGLCMDPPRQQYLQHPYSQWQGGGAAALPFHPLQQRAYPPTALSGPVVAPPAYSQPPPHPTLAAGVQAGYVSTTTTLAANLQTIIQTPVDQSSTGYPQPQLLPATHPMGMQGTASVVRPECPYQYHSCVPPSAYPPQPQYSAQPYPPPQQPWGYAAIQSGPGVVPYTHPQPFPHSTSAVGAQAISAPTTTTFTAALQPSVQTPAGQVLQTRRRDERPDLPTLGKFPHPSGDISIMQQVVPQYKQLGNILLKSPNGVRVLSIEKSKAHDVNDVVYEIFRQWLVEDADATWGKLVQHLENVNLSPLAHKINSCLM